MTIAVNNSTGDDMTVNLVGVMNSSDLSCLSIYDSNTGSPVYYYPDFGKWQWHVSLAEKESDVAEQVNNIYGEDEAEYEAAADKQLEPYGLKLGDYVPELPFTVDGYTYPAYKLEEL